MNAEYRETIQKPEIPPEFKELLKMDIVNDWLETYAKDTRPQKKHNLEMFLGWLRRSAEDTLSLRKQDVNRGMEKLAIKWVNFLIEKEEYKPSTAVNKLGTVRAWFQYHDMPLRFKRNELPKPKPSPRKFSLTIENVRYMWKYFPLWMQAICIVALENGLRISDCLGLKRADVENILNQELPSMEISTQKTGVIARIHLSNEAKEILEAYLKTIPETQKRLFVKDVDTINKNLQKAFKLAYPTIQFRPTFKAFRQIFLSTGSNLGISEWHLRLMCGKTVPADMLPYLRNLHLKSDFLKIKARLTIQQVNNVQPKLKEILDCVVEALLPLVEDKLREKGIHVLKEARAIDLLQTYHKLLERHKLGSDYKPNEKKRDMYVQS